MNGPTTPDRRTVDGVVGGQPPVTPETKSEHDGIKRGTSSDPGPRARSEHRGRQQCDRRALHGRREGLGARADVSSAAELAVELEDREDAFSDIELDVSPLDVSGDCACVEWVAQMTHSGPFVVDDDVVIDPTGVARHD